MHRSLILVGLFLVGILLVGCKASTSTSIDALENPLTAEYVADSMLEYVTFMRIRAEEKGEKITDPTVLRAIDEVMVSSRELQKKAHAAQDAGKGGSLYGWGGNFGAGEILLSGETLYTSYEFELSVAPEVEVYLAKHVNPHTAEELFSQTAKSLGSIQSYRGAQRYAVGVLSQSDWNEFRTVVFYSKGMKQVIALAQLQGKVR